MRKTIIYLILMICSINIGLAQRSRYMSWENLCKKKAKICIVSDIPDSIVSYPFVKELSKSFIDNGRWDITRSFSEANIILLFRGYVIDIGMSKILNCYAIVFDKNFNFLCRTKGYPIMGGWEKVEEQYYGNKFVKNIIKDISRQSKKKASQDVNDVETVDEKSFSENYVNALNSMANYDYKAAVGYLNNSLKADPSQWQLYKILGYCYAELFEYKSAVNSLEMYIQHNPLDVEADYLYGFYESCRLVKKINRSVRASQILSIGLIALNNFTKSVSPMSVNTHLEGDNIIKSTNLSGSNKHVCTACHGSGKNLVKERPAFYSYSEDPQNGHCEICGDKSIHYHNSCPSCMGRGYILKVF